MAALIYSDRVVYRIQRREAGVEIVSDHAVVLRLAGVSYLSSHRKASCWSSLRARATE